MPRLVRCAADIARRLRRFGSDRRGNVLIIFTIALMPMAMATGMAVDYTKAMRLQTKLNAAADAAALAAVSKQVMDMPARFGMAPEMSPYVGAEAATRIFHIGADPIVNPGNVILDFNDTNQFKVEITDNAAHTNRVAKVTYRAKSVNTFGTLLGISTLTITGAASSTVTAAAYVDIHLVLDTSQSMGLAATDADAAKLWNGFITYNGRGCQFGCHVPAGGESKAGDWIAQQVGATLRVDVLRTAALDMVQTAIDSEGATPLFRFAMYRIGQTTTDISALTTNLAQSKTDVAGLTLGPNDAGGTGDSNFAHMTSYVLPKIPVRGDGSSASNPKAYIFIVTDGVADVAGGCTYGHCVAPINPTTCQAYKDAGVTVGVVYTTYFPVKANPMNPSDTSLRPEYTDLVMPFASDIAPKLQACASTGWYFEASDGPTIHAAMQRLFAQAAQSPILTR